MWPTNPSRLASPRVVAHVGRGLVLEDLGAQRGVGQRVRLQLDGERAGSVPWHSGVGSPARWAHRYRHRSARRRSCSRRPGPRSGSGRPGRRPSGGRPGRPGRRSGPSRTARRWRATGRSPDSRDPVEQPEPGAGVRWSVVPVSSTLMMNLKFVIASPFVTPAPPNARGSVRALVTLSATTLVVAASSWRRGQDDEQAREQARDHGGARDPAASPRHRCDGQVRQRSRPF